MEYGYYNGKMVPVEPTPRISPAELSFRLEVGDTSEKLQIFMDETTPTRIRALLCRDLEFFQSLSLSQVKSLLKFVEEGDIIRREDVLFNVKKQLKLHPNMAVSFLARV